VRQLNYLVREEFYMKLRSPLTIKLRNSIEIWKNLKNEKKPSKREI